MPTFKAPIYSKQVNAKGQNEPSYTFGVEFAPNEEMLTFVADNTNDISLESLEKCLIENVEWWNTFITLFLQASSKLFSKPYTVNHINKITKHALNGTASNEFPVNVLVQPVSIQIINGSFLIHWKYICEQIVIDIIQLPDSTENEVVPDLNKVIDGVEELNIDAVPIDTDATELELDNPEKAYERQKVKEARLRAKLAMYKAQNQMTRFYEKYGDEISDSESESDYSDEEV